ncbi:MAG TPA: baseplate J/gp47 family protein, partial [Polyangiaceae bacterium]|nr:baseplate J/gp47 family protein [Polyangiaceae bacterium]
MPIFYSQIVEESRARVKKDLLDLLDSVGFTATSWQEGAIGLALVELGAEIWSKLTAWAVFLKELGLNETSSGDGLTRFSKSHYDNVREEAVATQRSITLSCEATEGPHTFGLGDVLIAEPTGRTYRNVAGLGVTYPALLASDGTITLLFEAETAGKASNVADGTATIMATTYAGVTVTSDTLTRLGIDAESDARLKLRNETKWALLSLCLTRDGVVAVALKAAPAVTQVEVDDQNPRDQGTFDVYIAGVNATAGPTDVALVQAALAKRFFRPDACLTRAAPDVFVDLTGTVYYDSKYSAADVQKAVEDLDVGSLPTFLSTVPLGGFDFSPGPANLVPKNDIEATIR